MSDTHGPVAPSYCVRRSPPCPACIRPLPRDSSYVTCRFTRPSRRVPTCGFLRFAGGRKSGLASCLPDHSWRTTVFCGFSQKHRDTYRDTCRDTEARKL